jgi:hypothetical protein
MTTFTEIVAAVVVHSSAVALSHFGLTMTPALVDQDAPPAAERVVARTHTQQQHKVMKLTACPEGHQAARPVRV